MRFLWIPSACPSCLSACLPFSIPGCLLVNVRRKEGAMGREKKKKKRGLKGSQPVQFQPRIARPAEPRTCPRYLASVPIFRRKDESPARFSMSVVLATRERQRERAKNRPKDRRHLQRCKGTISSRLVARRPLGFALLPSLSPLSILKASVLAPARRCHRRRPCCRQVYTAW